MKGKKELDSLGLAGVIVNVVVTGIESIISVILLVAGLTVIWNDAIGLLYLVLALILGTLSIIALVFNAKVLAGELSYIKVASVLGFICLSILGSVLLIISSDEVVNDDTNKEFNLADTLTKFKELLNSEAITEEEFVALKRKLI